MGKNLSNRQIAKSSAMSHSFWGTFYSGVSETFITDYDNVMTEKKKADSKVVIP